eukprot:690674-Prorocentrum_minimum.AAC.1
MYPCLPKARPPGGGGGSGWREAHAAEMRECGPLCTPSAPPPHPLRPRVLGHLLGALSWVALSDADQADARRMTGRTAGMLLSDRIDAALSTEHLIFF